MAVPTKLSTAECPLLRDSGNFKVADLVEQFNQLVEQIRQIDSGEFAYLLNRQDIQGILDDVKRVRGQMTRPRYRVGFLGTSQAGKSTTLNNVLQQKIAKSGIAEATTSTITRVRRNDGPDKFSLRYMIQQQYLDRREKLCKALYILNSGSKTNQEILAYLSDPQKLLAAQTGEKEGEDEPSFESARARRNRTGEHVILPDDIPYLTDFLRSYDAHNQRLIAKDGRPKEIEIPFERRDSYLNHPAGASGPPSETLLIWDAEIGCPNPNIPVQLEAIDCPGLGSKRTIDTVMTKEFLPELDGALIFLKADQIRSKDIVEVLEILKTNFGNKLEGRVWVVCNKMDVLTRTHHFGEQDGRTYYDVIHDFLRDYQLPAEQIVFTSKRIYELAEGNGKAPLEQAAVLLSVTPQEPIPPKCKGDRMLATAFQHLLDDGGISHLRKLILDTVPGAVSQQIAGLAKRELQALQEELLHKVETEQRRVKGGRQQRDQAIQCHDTVLELMMDLGTRTEFFRPLADHIEQKLYERLAPSEQRVRVILQMPIDDLSKQFRLHAETLDQQLDDLMNADVIDRLYAEVTEKMEGLPVVPLGRHAGGIHEMWQNYRREDRDPKSWRGNDFPSFRSPELFAGLTGAEIAHSFDGAAYLDLMKEKIRVATHQVMHSVRVQMRRRLRMMEKELSLLIWKPEAA
jgi:hypothetical protein